MMDISTARKNLRKLLCVNLDNYSLDGLRKLVKKRYLQWHPDKNTSNPERYRDNFILLNESWNVYKGGEGESQDSGNFSGSFETDGPNLFCDESMSESEESDYNSTPFDDDFFDTSPKKDFSVPEFCRLFFRSKSNRRAGKLFAIFILEKYRSELENFYKMKRDCDYFGAWTFRTNKDIICILIQYQLENRLIDIKKNLKKCKMWGAEIFYAVKFNKFIIELDEKCGKPFYEPVNRARTEKEKKPESTAKFNHKILVDFCISHEITEVYSCMYEYAHLAGPCDRTGYELTREHEEDHIEHKENAQIFVHMSDRKRVAKNAVDAVTANLFNFIRRMNNKDFLEDKCRIIGDRLFEITTTDIFGLADFYSRYVIPKHKFFAISKIILDRFVNAEPRKRWTGLVGPYGCGKTTYASAMSKLFEGVSINVNCPKERLAFYLGSAIGKRFVLLDDVKGRKCHYPPLLTPGNGFDNLDDLREHLDGDHEVQLEKKNQNPVHQVFPPGIITCNKYVIPDAIKTRVAFFSWTTNHELFKKHPFRVTMDTIFLSLVYHDLLPVESHVRTHIYAQKDAWWTEHDRSCNCTVSYILWVL